MNKKRCSKCKQIKPFTEFYKAKSNPDGHNSWCKLCNRHHGQTPQARAYQKRFRESERGRQYNLLWQKEYRQTQKSKASHSVSNKRYSLRYPEKEKAHLVVSNAIRAGELLAAKTFKCYYCPKPAQQWHHWHGYETENWLDVITVCQECHKKLHRRRKVI